MQTQSLITVPVDPLLANSLESNGARRNRVTKPPIEVIVSFDELLKATELQGRGWRGWLRVAQVGRVLGLLTLYLFLDSYDVRVKFNQRALDRCEKQRVVKGGQSGQKPGYDTLKSSSRSRNSPGALLRLPWQRWLGQERCTTCTAGRVVAREPDHSRPTLSRLARRSALAVIFCRCLTLKS